MLLKLCLHGAPDSVRYKRLLSLHSVYYFARTIHRKLAVAMTQSRRLAARSAVQAAPGNEREHAMEAAGKGRVTAEYQ